MRIVKISLLLSSLALFGCGPAPRVPQYTKTISVDHLDAKNEKNFYLLPLKGEVINHERYWSGDYWPLYQGSINNRWNTPDQMGFDYNSPTRDEVLKMTTEQIAQLSPSEKYDVLMGRYDYPFKQEVYTHAKKTAEKWEGICNGWAPATMNHNEPTPKTLINPDGVTVSFGSADIKALVSYYYAFIHKVDNTQQMGKRCIRGIRGQLDTGCLNDLDAGSFHTVLANKVGMKNESFLVDIERFQEVLNHPVFSYSSREEGEADIEKGAPRGTKKALKIRTKVLYVDESPKNTWEPVIGTENQKTLDREYVYLIYMGHNDQILGGEWISGDRPDFLWTMAPARRFGELLEGLGRLLND